MQPYKAYEIFKLLKPVIFIYKKQKEHFKVRAKVINEKSSYYKLEIIIKYNKNQILNQKKYGKSKRGVKIVNYSQYEYNFFIS